MAMDPTQVKPGSQVTVVTGTDFSVNAPPATTTSAPAGASRAEHDDDDHVGQQRQHGELRRLPGADADRRGVATLGPPVVHRQRGRRALTAVVTARRASDSGEDLAPVGVERLPVMADERSEAR